MQIIFYLSKRVRFHDLAVFVWFNIMIVKIWDNCIDLDQQPTDVAFDSKLATKIFVHFMEFQRLKMMSEEYLWFFLENLRQIHGSDRGDSKEWSSCWEVSLIWHGRYIKCFTTTIHAYGHTVLVLIKFTKFAVALRIL